jgi:hypothetical protein
VLIKLLFPESGFMTASNITEALVKARLGIDQTRLARLSTQTAIERSRHSIAKMRTLLDGLAHLPRRAHHSPGIIKGEAAAEAQKLLLALTKIKKHNA